jgi:hypothetical protein
MVGRHQPASSAIHPASCAVDTSTAILRCRIFSRTLGLRSKGSRCIWPAARRRRSIPPATSPGGTSWRTTATATCTLLASIPKRIRPVRKNGAGRDVHRDPLKGAEITFPAARSIGNQIAAGIRMVLQGERRACIAQRQPAELSEGRRSLHRPGAAWRFRGVYADAHRGTVADRRSGCERRNDVSEYAAKGVRFEHIDGPG